MDPKARIAALTQRVGDLEDEKRAAYAERNKVVAAFSQMAQHFGFRAGVGSCDLTDRVCDDTCNTIVFVDLPTGQVSWRIHPEEKPLFSSLPHYPDPHDGHDTNENYVRLLSADYASPPVPRGRVLPLSHS